LRAAAVSLASVRLVECSPIVGATANDAEAARISDFTHCDFEV